jgi:hypothetical protein
MSALPSILSPLTPAALIRCTDWLGSAVEYLHAACAFITALFMWLGFVIGWSLVGGLVTYGLCWCVMKLYICIKSGKCAATIPAVKDDPSRPKKVSHIFHDK